MVLLSPTSTAERAFLDVLIAAVAERHGLSVLQHLRDLGLVTAVTGQDVECIVPRGSVP